MDASREEKTRAALAKIYAANHEKIMARIQVLEEALTALKAGHLPDEQRRQAEGEAHKLAGVLGTFGLAQGTVLARELEGLFKGDEPISPDSVERLEGLTRSLHQEIKAP